VAAVEVDLALIPVMVEEETQHLTQAAAVVEQTILEALSLVEMAALEL